jgi:putative FmdB family regulatory protein
MPLYEYKCECGNKWEELLEVHQAHSAYQCPKCAKMAPQVFSPCAIKVWNYDPSVMDADADAKRCGVER